MEENRRSRKNRLYRNMTTSFLLQITTVICGLILPRLLLQCYGSEVNGLINSITQFLQIFVFFDFGVSAVVQSSLYGPLAENNVSNINKIMTSASRFFKKIAILLLMYVFALIIVYPLISRQEFGMGYISILILAMSISAFAEYYFGMVDRIFLSAVQHIYVHNLLQIFCVIMNTVVSIIMIRMNAPIQVVKLLTSIIFLIRPILQRIYLNRKYSINRRTSYSIEPIKQKWNGVAQHLASVVLDSTDVVVLTIGATLSDVSIYSVYFMIVGGVKKLLLSTTIGLTSLLGELFAKRENNTLKNIFGWYQWAVHTITVYIFGCTAMLILPFIEVYTLKIHDTNYFQPLFSVIIIVANALHCLRLPYHSLILASGHYKQTQNSYIVAALLNVVISIATVYHLGLVGVVVGTLIAMIYQIFWMINYVSKNLVELSIKDLLKQTITDIVTILIGVIATRKFEMSLENYCSWIILASKIVIVWGVIVLVINCFIYRTMIFLLINKLLSKYVKKER